jgi:hypothetical protein
MMQNWLAVHDGLIGATRFPTLARSRPHVSIAELLLLMASGAAAAGAVGLIKLQLRIPGHAILLAALPMALGMSLAPRRMAGSVMGVGALGTALWLTSAGTADFGSGAIVSLTLLGPMMDVVLRRVQQGWRVYAALVVAGLATNLLALGSRASTKLLGLDPGRPFDSWWLQAIVTYSLSGIVAGLLGALCWFHLRDRSERGSRA